MFPELENDEDDHTQIPNGELVSFGNLRFPIFRLKINLDHLYNKNYSLLLQVIHAQIPNGELGSKTGNRVLSHILASSFKVNIDLIFCSETKKMILCFEFQT